MRSLCRVLLNIAFFAVAVDSAGRHIYGIYILNPNPKS